MIRQFELVERVKAYDPAADEDALNRAYVFAMKAHGSQTRASGDPYFSHPLEVAGILTEFKVDFASIITALLHDTIRITHDALVAYFGIARPRIAVAGLNPHAGEGGLFGDEETRVIEPAMQMARNAGMHVEGPFPADTIFTPRIRNRYDGIVAMYHDQALIPIKLLAFDTAVNVTLGLPVIRTGVDHGTAFDIAGKGQADPGSMKEALRLACLLASNTTAAKWSPSRATVPKV